MSNHFTARLWAAILLSAILLPRIAAEELDPGLTLQSAKLTPDDEKLVRSWFKELGSEEFDARERALNKLTGKGPAVLPIASEFIHDPDKEIADAARSLPSKILLDYDGYLPADPALRKTLESPPAVKLEWVREGRDQPAEVMATLRKFCGNNKIKLELDATYAPQQIVAQFDFQGMDLSKHKAEMILHLLEFIGGLGGIARGDSYLLTSPDKVQRLMIQRHTFDWSGLDFNQEEAQRAGKELAFFFPTTDTEIHTGSNALLLRGREDAIQRAARIIALLNPKSADALWPAASAPASDSETLAAMLAKPIAIQMVSDSLPDALAVLTRQIPGVTMREAESASNLAGIPGIGIEPMQLDIATLRLNFSQGGMPLGLVCRWVERRTKFSSLPETAVFSFDIDPEKHTIYFQPRVRTVFSFGQHVAGADVTFLYKQPPQFDAQSDAAVRLRLIEVLDSHLALFPALNFDTDLRVFHGRMLLQGAPTTLARALALVRNWRQANKPPDPAEWKKAIERALEAEIEWDGGGLTGGKVLTALRSLGKINILLEDGPAGVANFELSKEDAQLLPPGRHKLSALLDDLAQRAHASWKIEQGAVVLTPLK